MNMVCLDHLDSFSVILYGFCLIFLQLIVSFSADKLKPPVQVQSDSGLKFPVLDPRGIDQQTRQHLLNAKSHSRPEQAAENQGRVFF